MKLGLFDLAVVAAYLVVVLFVGLRAGRKDRETDDYFVAGRSLPGWLVGLSILGTCISSVTYVAYPGKAFVSDWQYLVQGLMLPLVLAAGGWLFVRFYRRQVRTSVNEFLEARFSPGLRLFSFFFLLSSELFRVGSILYLFGLVLHAVSGLPLAPVIITLGAVTVVYTAAGGIRGVIWTDAIQSVLLVGAGIAAVAVASLHLPDGFVGMLTAAWEQGKLRLFDFAPDLARDGFWVLALSGVINYFFFLGGNQNQIQRYQCASSDREALKATLLGSLLSVPVWALFLLVGTTLAIYYQYHPDPVTSTLLASKQTDKVFPHFIATALPTGLSGLLLAGLTAAAMSSLDSSLNAASTLTITDLWHRFLQPALPPSRGLLLARTLTLFWGIIGILLALAMIRIEVFLSFYFKIVSLVIGALTGVFFLAVLVRPAHSRGVWIGVASASLVILWGALDMAGLLSRHWPGLKFPWHPIMAGVLGCLAVIVVGASASLLLPPRKRHPPPPDSSRLSSA